MLTALAFAVLAGLSYWIVQLVRVAMKKPGAKKQALRGLGFAIACFAVLAIIAPKPTEAERRATVDAKAQAKIVRACSDDGMFFVVAQKFVRQALKAPATAHFPSSPTQVIKIADCRYVVTSYVDAQNSFGAQIRSTWGVDLEYLPATDTYQAHNVEIQ